VSAIILVIGDGYGMWMLILIAGVRLCTGHNPHNHPLIGFIAHVKSHFPFITGSDLNKVIGMPEVDLGIDLGTAG